MTHTEGSGAHDTALASSAIDVSAVQRVMAELRSQGVRDPSLDEVAAVLGCDPAAVLGLLSSESAHGQDDGERPESAVEPA